jgi:hypothetical protein
MRWWRRPWFELRVIAVWLFLVWERIGLAKGMHRTDSPRDQDNNFTLTGSRAVSETAVSSRELLEICLAENDRRFAGYDHRLRRPTTVPRLARFANRFMRRRR